MTDDTFDLESVYDDQIAPLMKQIIAICKTHKMPIAATLEYATDNHCTTVISFDRASHRMQEIMHHMRPHRTSSLAVTESTDADGRTTISVARV